MKATIVKLRQKQLKGKKSLYLDFYPPILHPVTGEPTRREFLKLYIIDDDIHKKANAETLQLAENIRNERQYLIAKGQYGFLGNKNSNIDFVKFFEDFANEKKGGNKRGWLTALGYLKKYKKTLSFSELNESVCNEFKNHLINTKRKKGLSQHTLTLNSARTYFNKFKAALKEAYKKGYLDKDLSTIVEGIKEPETDREYLTADEIQLLVDTPCTVPVIKNASLFSILTGLRISDIEKLVWSEIRNENGEYLIKFRQKKTGGLEYLPITKVAYELLGEPKEPNKQVFEGIKYSAYFNVHLKQWILRAGITKNITFHCFRHTNAILLLQNGADIYTVSKMLGHREIGTTQRYAKIVDKQRRDAANSINLNDIGL